MSKFKASAVICCRWEEASIREWLIYHASIGIEHVFLYCNDDCPQAMFEVCLPFMVGPTPFLTFTHWPEQGQQREMYKDFLRRYCSLTEWFTFIDADEFIYIHRGQNIMEFIASFRPQPDVVYLNWLMFGHSGFIERPDGYVMDNYTKHENNFHPFTKIFVRSDIVERGEIDSMNSHFWHDWPIQRPKQVTKINVLGESMDSYYLDFPVNAVDYIFRPEVKEAIRSSAFICHFAMKSEADFERRAARGLAGDFSAQAMWSDQKQSGKFRETLRNMDTESFEGLKEVASKLFSWKNSREPI